LNNLRVLTKKLTMKRKNPFLLLFSLTLIIFVIGGATSRVEAVGTADQVTIRITGTTLDELSGMDVPPDQVIDYGSFLWATLTPDHTTALDAAGIAYEPIADAFTLDLGGERFDPMVQAPVFLSPNMQQADPVGKDLRLVQFKGPIKDAWLGRLENSGLEIVQYIHPYTYIVWGTRANLAMASEAQAVRWTGDFAPQYRLLPVNRALPEASLTVNVLLYRGADVDGLITSIQRLGARLISSAIMDRTLAIAQFEVSSSLLDEIAALPGVYSVQPVPTDGGERGEMSSQVNAGNYDGTNLAFTGYRGWLENLGLSGAGVIIANVDSGVDDNHPDLVNNMLPCIGSSCAGNTQSNHGTHTAGIMAADGASGMLDVRGFLRGLGVAPGANLVEQLYSPTYTYANGMLTLMQQSYTNGASLSGNSWGPSGTPKGYDADTRQVDVGVRDVDPLTEGYQPLSYVLSIMNGNGGTSSQGTPDEAKNSFTVGSTQIQNSTGTQSLAINNLSSNTAHGPALDGRIIPHLVAPGCYVDSTNINSYQLLCGTSMASPQVSGSVALFIDYYRQQYGVDPSPALIKAAFLPVAHDLAGNLDADGGILGHRFDAKQGWGRLDLAAVLKPQGKVLYFDAPQVFDNSSETWSYSLNLLDVGQPVHIMLAWTDAPGHGLGGSTPAWNNDLDLSVSVGGEIYLGNNFDPLTGWSQSGGVADFRNNTEGVLLPGVPGGFVTITVSAANINSDGLPNSGDLTDQDFALVIYTGQYRYIFPLVFSAIQ